MTFSLSTFCESLFPLIQAGDWRQALVSSWVALVKHAGHSVDEVMPLVDRVKVEIEFFESTFFGWQGDTVTPDFTFVVDRMGIQPLAVLAALDLCLAKCLSDGHGHSLAPNQLFDFFPEIVYVDTNWLAGLGISENTLGYWLIPRADSRISAIESGIRHDQHFLPKHRVVAREHDDGLAVAVRGCPASLVGSPSWLARKDVGITVYAAEFSLIALRSQYMPVYGQPECWVANGIYNQFDCFNELVTHLRRALEKKATIVVFPELSIDFVMRREISKWLKDFNKGDHLIEFVVAGSFHDYANSAANAGKPFNSSVTLDGQGCLMGEMTHKKIKPVDLRRIGRENAIGEGIARGSEVSLVLTPIGVQSVLICFDFADRSSHKLNLTKIPINWLWVPAMSNRIKPFWTSAEDLALNTPSLVAVSNQRNVTLDGEFLSLDEDDISSQAKSFVHGSQDLIVTEKKGALWTSWHVAVKPSSMTAKATNNGRQSDLTP
jgi:hypothetical protein